MTFYEKVSHCHILVWGGPCISQSEMIPCHFCYNWSLCPQCPIHIPLLFNIHCLFWSFLLPSCWHCVNSFLVSEIWTGLCAEFLLVNTGYDEIQGHLFSFFLIMNIVVLGKTSACFMFLVMPSLSSQWGGMLPSHHPQVFPSHVIPSWCSLHI